MRVDVVTAAARNLATWFDWQLRSHGLDCRRSESLWSCWQAHPGIFFSAVALSPGDNHERPELIDEIARMVAARPHDHVLICDWWMSLDLSHLGFAPDEPAPYFIREPPQRAGVAIPEGLEIEPVADPKSLEEFEAASAEGFGQVSAPNRTRWHAEASLGDPNLRYWLGRVDGRAVSASIGCHSDGVLGVYGVATIPRFRHRGFGTALTQAAVNVAPGAPAVLGPSAEAESIYRKMGFVDLHEFRVWRRSGSA